MLNCCLLTQTVLLMKSNQKMFMNYFLSGKVSLILVTFQKFFNETNRKIIGKMKDEFSGAQWASDLLWTSNGRSYKVWTSYRRPLDVQRTSDAHWELL